MNELDYRDTEWVYDELNRLHIERDYIAARLASIHTWFVRECAAAPDSGEVVDAGAREAFGHLCHALAALSATESVPRNKSSGAA